MFVQNLSKFEFSYPVKPSKFISFLFNYDESAERMLDEYKQRIKYAGAASIGLIIVNVIVKVFI